MNLRWCVISMGVLASVACGDSSGTGAGGAGQGGGVSDCIADPFSCPSGQTCWIDTDQTHFHCLNSGAGVAGDTCKNFVGQPSCEDGLTCLQLQGAESGVCTPFCDPTDTAHGCSDGESCILVTLGDAEYHACQPQTGQGGGGTGGAATGGAPGAGGG